MPATRVLRNGSMNTSESQNAPDAFKLTGTENMDNKNQILLMLKYFCDNTSETHAASPADITKHHENCGNYPNYWLRETKAHDIFHTVWWRAPLKSHGASLPGW